MDPFTLLEEHEGGHGCNFVATSSITTHININFQENCLTILLTELSKYWSNVLTRSTPVTKSKRESYLKYFQLVLTYQVAKK